MRGVACLLLVQLAVQQCCIDHTGRCQPFFAALKQPDGYEALVYDNDTQSLSAQVNVTDPHRFVGATLAPLYKNTSEFAYLMYNDQNPDDGRQASTKAHSKGILIMSKRAAVWLLHSVPLWPKSPPSPLTYPATGVKYAQSFLCLTLRPDSADAVGKAFLTTRPNVYASSFPSQYRAQYPNLATVANGTYDNSSNPTVVTIESVGNHAPFLFFAKSGKWGEDLGEDLVGPFYNSDFVWETWRRGVGNMPSYCRGQGGCVLSSLNMQGVKLGDRQWPVVDDHSKWGISWMDTENSSDDRAAVPTVAPSAKVICVGDINRQESQRRRGGGTVCTEDPGMYKAFKEIVLGVDKTVCGSCDSRIPKASPGQPPVPDDDPAAPTDNGGLADVGEAVEMPGDEQHRFDIRLNMELLGRR